MRGYGSSAQPWFSPAQVWHKDAKFSKVYLSSASEYGWLCNTCVTVMTHTNGPNLRVQPEYNLPCRGAAAGLVDFAWTLHGPDVEGDGFRLVVATSSAHPNSQQRKWLNTATRGKTYKKSTYPSFEPHHQLWLDELASENRLQSPFRGKLSRTWLNKGGNTRATIGPHANLWNVLVNFQIQNEILTP